jgi:hypothetical protein
MRLVLADLFDAARCFASGMKLLLSDENRGHRAVERLTQASPNRDHNTKSWEGRREDESTGEMACFWPLGRR